MSGKGSLSLSWGEPFTQNFAPGFKGAPHFTHTPDVTGADTSAVAFASSSARLHPHLVQNFALLLTSV